jgi:catechol 2,3-dioxygenase-like lactoylglutathione lyase family enzyme
MKLNYAVAGTNDMETAITFYTALFAQSGLQSLRASERMNYWVNDEFAFAVATPFDDRPATVGNGMMIGFGVEDASEVDRLHALALELGGACAGQPGPRGQKYSAYIRDPDGNKLCFSA